MRKKPAAKIFIFTFLLLSPYTIFVAEHEYTHYYFAQEHNCENIKIHGPSIEQNRMASISYNPNTCEREKMLQKKQEMVEAVGYQLQVLLLFIGLQNVILYKLLKQTNNN